MNGALSGLSGMGGVSAIAGPSYVQQSEEQPWTPADDPNIAAWWEGHSYELGMASGGEGSFQYAIPIAVYPPANNDYDQNPISTPAEASVSVQAITEDNIPVFRYQSSGTKCVQTFSFDGADIYIIGKSIGTSGGQFCRFLDSDYGNGFWIGSGGDGGHGAGVYQGGIKVGNDPYGYKIIVGSDGWFMLQTCRIPVGEVTPLFPYPYQFIYNADVSGDLSGDASDGGLGLTTANPIAIGSDLGGANPVPGLYVAGVAVYNDCPAAWNGTYNDTIARRQGYWHNKLRDLSLGACQLISDASHPYYSSAPTL